MFLIVILPFLLATPAGSSQAPFPVRSRHVSESLSPVTASYGGGYRGNTASLTPTTLNQHKHLRQKSTSESGNPTQSLSASIARRLNSPLSHKIRRAESRDMVRIRKDSVTSTDTADTPYGARGSINQNHPLKFHRQKSVSESQAVTPTQSVFAVRVRRVRGESVSSESTDGGRGIVGGASLQRQGSYEIAVGSSDEEEVDQTAIEQEFSFPVSIYASACSLSIMHNIIIIMYIIIRIAS